jgi:transcriptional regulator with XRE-family HTH domain
MAAQEIKTIDLKKAIRIGMAKKGFDKTEDLSDGGEMSASAINSWIRGDRSPNLKNLEKLAAAFGMKVSDFLKLGEDAAA